MSTLLSSLPAESDIRFLDYRLEVIRYWPPSARKQVTVEAISRRLATIALSTAAPGNEDLLALSCHLLDQVFAGRVEHEEPVPRNTAGRQEADRPAA